MSNAGETKAQIFGEKAFRGGFGRALAIGPLWVGSDLLRVWGIAHVQALHGHKTSTSKLGGGFPHPAQDPLPGRHCFRECDALSRSIPRPGRHRGLVPRKGDLGGSIRTVLAMFGVGKEPEADKFLPEQRYAYAYMAVVGGILVLTGLVKVIKNLDGVLLPAGLVTGVTLVHTFGTIFFLLGVLAHLGALLIKANRPLIRAILTGKVDADYARERHGIWWERELRNAGAWTPPGLTLGESSGQDAGGKDVRKGPFGQGAHDVSLAREPSPDAVPVCHEPPARSKAGEL